MRDITMVICIAFNNNQFFDAGEPLRFNEPIDLERDKRKAFRWRGHSSVKRMREVKQWLEDHHIGGMNPPQVIALPDLHDGRYIVA